MDKNKEEQESGLAECPKCGAEYDTSEHKLLKCPTCEQEGSTACCMINGEGEDCVDCAGIIDYDDEYQSDFNDEE